MAKRKGGRHIPELESTPDALPNEELRLGPGGIVSAQVTPTLAQNLSSSRPTRREKRKEAEVAMVICQALVELPEQKLAKIPLPDDIADEVQCARKIRSNAAKKRQMLYLAKIMRNSDEQEEIAIALQRLSDLDRRGTAEFQRLESWRTRLLEDNDNALEIFCTQYPNADENELRKIIQSAHTRTGTHRTAASRALFRELRRIVAESSPSSARSSSETP